MTLDQLEMLEAIILEGSFQAAARRLHKSQPSLTAGIKKIEEYYSIEIFSREGYRPVLTDVGRRFYESTKTTLAAYRQLHKVATELGDGVEPRLEISIDPIVMAIRLTPLFDTFLDNEFKSELLISSGVLFDNATKLLDGECDLAIGSYPLIDREKIEHHKICDITLIPVIHKSLIGDSVDEFSLKSIPNIVVQTKADQGLTVSTNSGLKWSVDSHARKTELIAMGVGWGRISSLQLEEYQDLIEIDENIVERITIDIHLMRHRERAQGPIARRIWNKLVKSSII